MNLIKTHIGGIIVGLCIAITAFAVWIMWQSQVRIANLENNVAGIVQFINNAQAQQVKK